MNTPLEFTKQLGRLQESSTNGDCVSPQSYAHTDPKSADPADWEPLFTPDCPALKGGCCEACERMDRFHGHLNKVAWWTAKFAEAMFPSGSEKAKAARKWGYLAGIWHDLGKFAPEWQRYLQSKVDPHVDDVSGKVDHSTAGAQYLVKLHEVLGHLLAYTIAGHHSGLLDGESNTACQASRLDKKDIPDYTASIPAAIASLPHPAFPDFLREEFDSFSVSLFTRMLFSSLVDADFLATESFMNPSQAVSRNRVPDHVLSAITDLVDAEIDAFGLPIRGDVVNEQRRAVVEDCRTAAALPVGLFTLTVPTGGGKTLSSLSFALRHAMAHGQQRVIYVVPFNSIIEQNAEIVRKILKPLETSDFTPVIEHHSSLSPDKESTQSRLASENWDAPIIITTAVQFYESLFAAKTSRCRKLHNIANSVIILDEAQTLPVDYISPCLQVLQELSDNYQASIVLCTATQPAIHHHETEFPIGLKNAREIIVDPTSLFAALKRVELTSLGDLSDTDLVNRLSEHLQVLCIVNRRKHAQQLFRKLGKGDGNFHLSALMCPEHRHRILTEIRWRLKEGMPVRTISTQLIEAGVDVDFPVVYRALAGLDSIAQAAGRCNRNGRCPSLGCTYIFQPEDKTGETYFRETAQVSNQLIGLHEDLLGREAIRHYFDLYYYQQKSRWDSKDILGQFHLSGGNRKFPFNFSYASGAEKFRLIEDWQVPVIIPYDEKAHELIGQLRNLKIPLNRNLLRSLQRYTVQIPPKLRDENIRSFEVLRDGEFHVLVSTDLNYSENFGLTFDEEYSGAQNLIS